MLFLQNCNSHSGPLPVRGISARSHLICIRKTGFLEVPPQQTLDAAIQDRRPRPPTRKHPLRNRQSSSHLQRPWPPLALSSFHLSCWRKRTQVSEGPLYTPSQHVFLTHSHASHSPEIQTLFSFLKLKYS